MENKYTIKQLSERFQMPASTIRYYEEIGLLTGVVHIDKYHREYNQSHADRLGSIQCFKMARLSLDQIKLFFEYEKDMNKNARNIVDLMKGQEEATKIQIDEMYAGLEHIQKKIAYYTSVAEAVEQGEKIPSWHEFFNLI